jgi:hypothetical protein
MTTAVAAGTTVRCRASIPRGNQKPQADRLCKFVVIHAGEAMECETASGEESTRAMMTGAAEECGSRTMWRIRKGMVPIRAGQVILHCIRSLDAEMEQRGAQTWRGLSVGVVVHEWGVSNSSGSGIRRGDRGRDRAKRR